LDRKPVYRIASGNKTGFLSFTKELILQTEATKNHEQHEVGGDQLRFRVTSAGSDGALLAFDIRMPPGGGPPALHRHAAAELYRVERGEFTFYIGGPDGRVTRSAARAGEVISIPGGCEHTVRNESTAAAEAFVVLAPAEQFERFVRAAALGGDVAALAAEHGVEITRPLEAVT
jgi:oxalate decarboxylase/phosphoglucose isomerase-like protein (cupin superfamily)